MNRDAGIKDVKVRLVERAVKGDFSDATRDVETIGYVVTVVELEDGRSGFGLTYHEVGGEAIREFILCALKPKLIGRSPLETEALWNELMPYIRGVGRKGLAFCAYSAVDIALWDLKGKLLELPLYRLLGGTKRPIPIYASGGWTSYSGEELVREAEEMVNRGYTKIKIKIGVNGGQDPDEDVRRVAAVREAIGPKVGLMLDANNAFTAGDAARLANRLREFNVLFLEEPVMADDIPGLKRFRRATDIPLATGEHEYTKYGVRDLILSEAADYVQCDVTRCGGYTEILKIMGMTQAWNLSFAPHGMEYMHMHLMAAAPNAPFLERLFMFEDLSAAIFQDAPQPSGGYLELPDAPGLGIRLNDDAIGEGAR